MTDDVEEVVHVLRDTIKEVDNIDQMIGEAEDDRGLPRSKPSDLLDWRLSRIGVKPVTF